MHMHLPTDVELIIGMLNQNGYRADAVGGCVRDALLGCEPNDYDITTSATPDEMHRVFSDFYTIDTGIKHGTLSVMLNEKRYEITTYRIDGEYSDNRHPDNVRFSRQLSDDLSRRDFTVNAMCYNHTDGLTDLFGGREDLRCGIIRAVGDPTRRFSEDALRIVRALRFASVLGFSIERVTAEAVKELAPLTENVARERILVEWRKLIAGKYAYEIISEFSSVISIIIPTLSRVTLPDKARFNQSTPELRELSLFYLSCGEACSEAFSTAMRGLRSDNAHKSRGTNILSGIFEKCDTELDVKHLLIKYGKECTEGIIKLKILLGKANALELDTFNSLIKNKFPHRIRDLKIDGNDLSSVGITGKSIGYTLNALLYCIADGTVKNEWEDLLSVAQKIANSIEL